MDKKPFLQLLWRFYRRWKYHRRRQMATALRKLLRWHGFSRQLYLHLQHNNTLYTNIINVCTICYGLVCYNIDKKFIQRFYFTIIKRKVYKPGVKVIVMCWLVPFFRRHGVFLQGVSCTRLCKPSCFPPEKLQMQIFINY